MSSTFIRTLGFPLRAALLMTIVLALPGLSLAQSALTDDAQTNSKARSADTNYGANVSLTVSPTTNAFIKFKLSSTLPAGTSGADIARATVKLYVGSIAAAGKIDVYQANGAWNENALTFNNSPLLGNLLATTAQIEEDKKGTFIVVDVTPAVQQWLGDDGQGTNGAPNHGLVLVPHPIDTLTPSLANITFDSKENVQTSHEPELHIAMKKSGGLESVAHDGTLSGDGSNASPLGLAPQSIGTAQLSDGSITKVKLADLIISSEKIADDAVTSNKLADGTVTSAKISNAAVTEPKIAAGQVLKRLNGLTDNVTLQAGANVTITPSGNTLTVASSGIAAVSHNGTLAGNGTGSSPLGVVVPLQLLGPAANPNPTLLVANQGNGTAISAVGTIDSSSHYSLGGGRMLSNPGAGNTFLGLGSGENNGTGAWNSFVGQFAGQSNTAGENNSFFGTSAGRFNTTGGSNAFFGNEAGVSNTTGFGNSFFGRHAGKSNTTGGGNAFFGAGAGVANTTGGQNAFFGNYAGGSNNEGHSNSFFGDGAGSANTTGLGNTFVGIQAGPYNTTGRHNTFFGLASGRSNTSENNNTFIGTLSNGAPGITNATAIGYEATVAQSNAVVLGNSADVGIGVTQPKARLHIAGGRVYVEANGQGLILKSPNGAVCIEITASNIGSLQYGPIACPQ